MDKPVINEKLIEIYEIEQNESVRILSEPHQRRNRVKSNDC